MKQGLGWAHIRVIGEPKSLEVSVGPAREVLCGASLCLMRPVRLAVLVRICCRSIRMTGKVPVVPAGAAKITKETTKLIRGRKVFWHLPGRILAAAV